MRSQIKEMTQEQRWEFIRRGLEQNKSRRAIAKELACDEGTIRRELRKLELPEEWVEAIKQGSPAEPFLRTLREYDADQYKERRTQEEQASGKHSVATAMVVLQWLLGKNLGDASTRMVLDTLEREFWRVGERAEAVHRDPRRLLSSMELEYESEPSCLPEKIEYCLALLRKALPKIAPEKLIRNRCFPLMVKQFEEICRQARARVTPLELYNRARLRRSQICGQ